MIKRFDFVPPEARKLREEVFLEEQGFAEEFDERDNTSSHLVMYDGEKAVAVCRFFYSEEKGCHMVGRVAVAKDHRGRKLGKALMLEAERLIREDGSDVIAVSSQCRVEGFYASLGYKKVSDVYLDEHCPHVLMKKTLR